MFRHGRYGLFPAEYVEKLSPNSIRREMKTITSLSEAQESPEEASTHQRVDRGVESLDEEDIRYVHNSMKSILFDGRNKSVKMSISNISYFWWCI